MMVKIPQTFKELDVPLPPMLLELVGVGKDIRFVALYNWYGKPNWSDGINCTTFPFFIVWQPYIQHQALTHQLHNFNFGTSEDEPTHALVCDHGGEQVYVAPFGEAIVFLNNQHEQTQPIAVRQWNRIKHQALAYTPVRSDRMQEVGMFERFLPPTPEQKQKATELLGWLDRYI